MAKFGQILYKIGKRFDHWGKKEVYRLTKAEFVRIMKSNEYPHYEARKTINEKWDGFRDIYGLVQSSGKNDELGEWILINSEAAKREIQESIPEKYHGVDRDLWLIGRV